MNYVTKPIPATRPVMKFVERPWGSFKQSAHNQETTVSLMTLLPGKRLSLQSHTGRAELWIVLDDGATVQVGEQTRVYSSGEEIWINANEKNRLSCAGDESVRREVCDARAFVMDLTRGGFGQARDGPQRRCLAGAVRSNQRHNVTALNGK